MTSDDLYRRNPARDVEQFAAEVVQSWVGVGGAVEDTSAGAGADFRIRYFDGRMAVGEVGWHADRVLQEMWGNAFKREKHQTIDLPQGLGTWSVQLGRGANIKQLYRQLCAFIQQLIDNNITKLEIFEAWPRTALATRARELGVKYVQSYPNGTADQAIFFMPASSGEVPSDPNVIADWIEALLADPDYSDTTAKLLPIAADEHHVFLMSGSATPFGADERLRRVDVSPPNRPLQVPDHISHVWAVSQYGNADVLLWTQDGWIVIPGPNQSEGNQ